jgi:anti-anti-sigma factor
MSEQHRGSGLAPNNPAGRSVSICKPATVTAAAKPPFAILQRHGVNGVVELRLLGELDVAAGGELGERLAQLRRGNTPVRLDLSRLSFIDCGGLHLVMDAVADARRAGWQLEVGRDVSAPVRRVLALTGTGPRLWPGKRLPGLARPAVTDALVTRVAGLLHARRITDGADQRRMTAGAHARRLPIPSVLRGR